MRLIGSLGFVFLSFGVVYALRLPNYGLAIDCTIGAVCAFGIALHDETP